MERLREVERVEVERLVEMWSECSGDGGGGIVHSMEVSAKDNTNIDHTFLLLAEQLKASHCITTPKNALLTCLYTYINIFRVCVARLYLDSIMNSHERL